MNPLTNQAQSGINYSVIRFADILLSKAEVLNELNGGPTTEAYAAIKRFATVLILPTSLQVSIKPILEKLFSWSAVKNFIQEGMSWFDLSRRGGLIYTMH